MSGASHRIRQLRWRVRTRSQKAAFALRARLRAELDQTLQPALTRVFDELAPGDEVVHLPRLEIHARVASVEELWRRCAAAFLRGAPPGDAGALLDTIAPAYRSILKSSDLDKKPALQERLRAMQRLYVERENGVRGTPNVLDPMFEDLRRAPSRPPRPRRPSAGSAPDAARIAEPPAPLTGHIHIASKAPWYRLADAIPQFPELPPS